MSENCDVIVFFQIYGQFAAIQKPDCGNMVYETYIFTNSSLLSYKTWKQNQKIFNAALILLLCVKLLFLQKNAKFLQKNADISKITGVLVLKGILSETTCACALTYKSIILTSFRSVFNHFEGLYLRG